MRLSDLEVFEILLPKGRFARMGSNMRGKALIRVFDKQVNPIAQITVRGSRHLEKLLRRDKKKGILVLDKKKVMVLHGNSRFKKAYLSYRKTNKK